MTTEDKLRDICKHVSDEITNPRTITEEDLDYCPDSVVGSPISAYEYLQDMLDIKYIVDSDRDYIGAEVLVAFGGPNIYITDNGNIVTGYWGSNKVEIPFTDNIGLSEYLEEMYNCI